jgi:hypothetical protein
VCVLSVNLLILRSIGVQSEKKCRELSYESRDHGTRTIKLEQFDREALVCRGLFTTAVD